MKYFFVIRTVRTDQYAVEADPPYRIIPLNQPDFVPSTDWCLFNIVEQGRFGRYSSMAGLLEGNLSLVLQKLAKLPTLRFKNLRPRYYVMDLDHGTIRRWSTGGIAQVYGPGELSRTPNGWVFRNLLGEEE